MKAAIMALASAALGGCASQGADRSADGDAVRRVVFVCDRSTSATVTFSKSDAVLESAALKVRLTAQPVASGMHYAGEGHDLRGKGPEMVWTSPGGVSVTCRDQAWAMRQPQIQPPRRDLAGTSWNLVNFQSSDDRVGTVTPPRIERYRITFSPSGELSAQLDCNRTTGRWEAGKAGPGSLAITGGAISRAFCGPGALDVQIARDLPRVRSYTFAGEMLSLSLEADGGTYLWAPAPSGG